MNEVEYALSQIADIRAQLAASTRFRGIAPEANAVMGALSLAVAVAQEIWPQVLAQDAFHFVAVWAAVAAASMVVASTEAISRSRRMHGEMAQAMLNTAMRQALPFGLAGVIVTIVICKFSPASICLLPGLWQILIALFGFSVLPSLPRAIVWVAGWFFVCGAFVLGLAAWSGTLSPWMMGVPFGIGQMAVAFVLYRVSGGLDG